MTKKPSTSDYPNYLSDSRPQFKPTTVNCGKIQMFQYSGDLKKELKGLEKKSAQLEESNPEIRPFVRLLNVCLVSYPELLTGSKSHMQVMFPKGSMELVEGIYKGNKIADYFNNLVANIIKTYIGHRLTDDPEAKISILEAGAGTGHH